MVNMRYRRRLFYAVFIYLTYINLLYINYFADNFLIFLLPDLSKARQGAGPADTAHFESRPDTRNSGSRIFFKSVRFC